MAANSRGLHTTMIRKFSVFVVLTCLAHLHTSSSLITHGSYFCESTDSHPTSHPTVDGGPAKIYSKGDFHNAFFQTFQSPKSSQWPNHYFPNMECWFNFTAPMDHQVYVEFPLFVIEGKSTFCHWDKDLVSIPTILGDRLVCGFPSDYGATITGRSNVSVHFKTNDVIEQVGFTGFFWSYEVRDSLSLQRHRRHIVEEPTAKQRPATRMSGRYRRQFPPPAPPHEHTQDEDDSPIEELTTEQREIIRKLRYITLNGVSAIRQIGCTDCRIAYYFSKCQCAGTSCTYPSSRNIAKEDDLQSTLFR